MKDIFEGLDERIIGCRSVPTILYHYTSPVGFSAIMNDENDGVRFMCTNYRFLNDDAEFNDGCKCAIKWLENHSAERPEVARKIIADIEKCRVEDRFGYHPWILSFSAKQDAAVQWASYTDRQKGGFSIGVDRLALAEKVRALDREIKDKLRSYDYGEAIGGASILPCIYYDRRTDENLGKFQEVLDYVFSNGEVFHALKDIDERKYATCCARQIIKLAALLKRKDFEFEDEWRVVVTPVDVPKFFSGIKVRGDKPRISLRDHLPDRDLVKEVWIAPHGSKGWNLELARIVKEIKKDSYELKPSESTYNGR